MKQGRLQKQVHPVITVALIAGALALVQWLWWRGLVYRPPMQPARMGGPSGGGGGVPSVQGREDVIVETLAGDLQPGSADGPGFLARFDRPAGIAVDPRGALYVADAGNHRIRRVEPDGLTSTVAGSAQGYLDGPAQQARFNGPCGIAIGPGGDLYIADTGNHCIRRIRDGQVTTVAGSPDGATLKLPIGIAFRQGTPPALLVADTGNRRIRRLNLDGRPLGDTPTAGAPTAVTPAGIAAIPDAAALLMNSGAVRGLRVMGAPPSPPDRPDPFAVAHPAAVCSTPDGIFLADSEHGVVFQLLGSEPEVLAGVSSGAGPLRGYRDGTGNRAAFTRIGGIAGDGKGTLFVADTGNNVIRRVRLGREEEF